MLVEGSACDALQAMMSLMKALQQSVGAVMLEEAGELCSCMRCGHLCTLDVVCINKLCTWLLLSFTRCPIGVE
jgi:hypothetical protein